MVDAGVADGVTDDEQIRALVGAYAERLDRGDLDGVAGLFTHGEFRSARRGEPLVGRDAVRAMFDSVVLYDDGTPRTKHVLGNIEVSVAADRRRATARCTFVVLQAAPDRPLAAVLSGRYHDRFVRDGEWRFAERTVHPDLLGDLASHMTRGADTRDRRR